MVLAVAFHLVRGALVEIPFSPAVAAASPAVLHNLIRVGGRNHPETLENGVLSDGGSLLTSFLRGSNCLSNATFCYQFCRHFGVVAG